MKNLNPKIIQLLSQKLSLTPKTIKNRIYGLAKNYPSLNKNALAQIYASKRGLNVYNLLDKEDKLSLPSNETVSEKILVKKDPRRYKATIKPLIDFQTNDYFIKGHIDELNKAHNYKCYTATFILLRKIIENLLIDVLKAKYPQDVDLYFDKNKGRAKDFGEVLENLYKKRSDFGTESKVVERINQLVKPLKGDTNDKTHSWYHLVKSPKEIEDLQIETIIELIKKIQ